MDMKNSMLSRFWIAVVTAFLFVIFSFSSLQAMEIGVAWAGKSGMSNRVTQGFEKGMAEFAPDIKIEYQKELPSVDALAEVAARFQKEKKGMVILRSNGAKWLGQNPPSIPTFIGGCNHPGQLGAVKNLAAPEGNITGVTYFLPVRTQFEIFKAVLPGLESVLLLIDPSNPSTVIDQEGTREVCESLGIAYNESACGSKDEVLGAVEAYLGKVTAMIIGNQATIIDNTAAAVEAAGNTPVFSYSSKPVKDGAVGGFAADDVQLGYMLAQSVVDVLVKGQAIKSVPIKVDPKPKFYINVKSAQRLNLDIPYEILETATLVE
jgi:putative tryptophan/tyrosine transport system substrate-binding protein